MAELSLLWPGGQPAPTWHISAETIRNLELEAVVQSMCAHAAYRDVVREVVFRLCLEGETIRRRFAQRLVANYNGPPA